MPGWSTGHDLLRHDFPGASSESYLKGQNMSTKQDRQEEAQDIKSGDDQPSNMSEVYLPFIGFFIVMAVGLGLVIGGFNALEYL